MRLEECLYELDCVIIVVQKICVRYKNVDRVIRSSILNILNDFLHLRVHCIWVKRYRIRDIRYGLMGIVEDSIEHCV